MEANETLIIAARRFLRRGSIGELSDVQIATACDRLVQDAFRTSIRKALLVAERFHARAARSRSRILLQTACRSLGRMHHFSGSHKRALKYYLQARSLSRGQPLVRGRIDRTLIDIYMYLGNIRAAQKYGRFAMRTFTALKADSDLAQTKVNLGNLYHRQDDPERAARFYQEAIRFFEQTDNRLALARCRYNQANALVQLFRMEEAAGLYRQALDVYLEAGYELDAADCRYGLAWLRLLTGDFHEALIDLAQCESIYRGAGDPRGGALCVLDRAEVYLHLGLYRDAHSGAQDAARRFRTLHLTYEEAKAYLYAAYALAGERKTARAKRELRLAEALFRALGHRGFLGAARLLLLDLDSHDSGPQGRRLEAVRRVFRDSELPFWSAVCDLRAADDPRRAEAALPRLRRNPAVGCVPHLFAAWQVLEGDSAARSGKREQALAFWQRAADRLDTVRAALPPMELRTRYSRAAKLPHTRLVESYLDTDPMLAAVWSERSRTAGVWKIGSHETELRMARQKAAQSLRALSDRVHSLSQHLASTALRSTASTGGRVAPRRFSYLHRQVRECLLELNQTDSRSLLSTAGLRRGLSAESADAAVVQFHLTERDIYALVHHRGGVAAKKFVDGVARLDHLDERWRFCMERAILKGPEKSKVVLDMEHSVWRELGAWLWAGLEVPSSSATVVIVPDGNLANLPWQAFEYKGVTVGDRHDVVLTPSLRHHWLARSQRPTGDEIHLFRGAAGDLPLIGEELQQLASLAPGRTTVHAPATRSAWPTAGDYFAWHYAGHADMARENPFYSSVRLEEGPLFAADFQFRRCGVALVTLAACRSGEEVAVPGEESTGLVRALLEMGARNVVASRWPVSDRATALFMERFYTELLSTSCLSKSLRRAEQQTRESYPSAYHWAAYGLYGAGTLGG